jgi:hypothetical protein
VRFDEIVARVQADLQRGVETVERARLDREGETRVFLTVGSVEVDLPVGPATGDDETDGEDGVDVTPGTGEGRISLSFVPSKVGPLEAAPDFPLEYLEGVGPARARDLTAAGVESVRALAAADPRTLSVETDLSAARARRFVEMARLVKLGADGQTAEALVELGFDRDRLATRTPDEVAAAIEEAVAAGDVSVPAGYEFDRSLVAPLVSRAELTGRVAGRLDADDLADAVRESVDRDESAE